MWSVCQVTLKLPSVATVVLTVGAHCQPVWWPRRSISIVLPAAPEVVPEKFRPLRSIVAALVLSVIPSPDALTGPLVEALGVLPLPVEVLEAEPEPPSPAPPLPLPRPGQRRAGRTARSGRRRGRRGMRGEIRVKISSSVCRFRCLRGELTGSRFRATTSNGPIRPRGPGSASGSPADRPRTDDRSAGWRRAVYVMPSEDRSAPLRSAGRSVLGPGRSAGGDRVGSAPRQPRQRAAQGPGAGLEADLGQFRGRLDSRFQWPWGVSGAPGVARAWPQVSRASPPVGAAWRAEPGLAWALGRPPWPEALGAVALGAFALGVALALGAAWALGAGLSPAGLWPWPPGCRRLRRGAGRLAGRPAGPSSGWPPRRCQPRGRRWRVRGHGGGR